jgi:hypothetical protein
MRLPSHQFGYFDLQALAAYSCCSVRWLRDRLADRTHPLPHHRVEGKVLVRRADFDKWMDVYRVCSQAQDVKRIVEDVWSGLIPTQHRA